MLNIVGHYTQKSLLPGSLSVGVDVVASSNRFGVSVQERIRSQYGGRIGELSFTEGDSDDLRVILSVPPAHEVWAYREVERLTRTINEEIRQVRESRDWVVAAPRR
jgi:hypothetical protein